MFVDYKNDDFCFASNSPAKKLGIVSLNLDNVGLTKDFPKRFRPGK